MNKMVHESVHDVAFATAARANVGGEDYVDVDAGGYLVLRKGTEILNWQLLK